MFLSFNSCLIINKDEPAIHLAGFGEGRGELLDGLIHLVDALARAGRVAAYQAVAAVVLAQDVVHFRPN